jgi:hypothetical protein
VAEYRPKYVKYVTLRSVGRGRIVQVQVQIFQGLSLILLVHTIKVGDNTLIRFGKFEEINVLMAKTCNFDANISDFNSVDLKKAKK